MSASQPSLSNRDLRVPFLKQLDQDLSTGGSIGFKGCLSGEAFTFNLATGKSVSIFTPKVDDKIALQVGYQAGRGLTLTSFAFNRWGDEVRFADIKLRPGKVFHISIQPQEDQFLISLNGNPVGEYKLIVPVNQVQYLFVQGEVSLQRVEFEGDYYMVPFKKTFDTFTEGSKLHVSGKPYPNAQRFSVDLTENGDIPVHFEVDFKLGVIRKNQAKRGEWREEQQIKQFPFQPDNFFDIVIAANDEFLEVYVDGTRFARYSYLVDPELSVCVKVNGDVQIHNVHLA